MIRRVTGPDSTLEIQTTEFLASALSPKKLVLKILPVSYSFKELPGMLFCGPTDQPNAVAFPQSLRSSERVSPGGRPIGQAADLSCPVRVGTRILVGSRWMGRALSSFTTNHFQCHTYLSSGPYSSLHLSSLRFLLQPFPNSYRSAALVKTTS